jgi:hypothetical protein
MKSPVATPTEPTRFWQKPYVKFTTEMLGISAVFTGLNAAWAWNFEHGSWSALCLTLTFLISSFVLMLSMLALSFGQGWNNPIYKWGRRIAWLLLIAGTIFMTSYVQAWKTDDTQAWSTDRSSSIIVRNGRTNIGRSFFANPFSRSEVLLRSFRATETVAWNSRTPLEASALFSVLPDEPLVLAFAAEAGSRAQTKLEIAARLRFDQIYKNLQKREATVNEAAENGTLEYWPDEEERSFANVRLPLRLVGPVTLSDVAGLPVKKVWVRH